jgi:hypothetical protein
MKPVWEKTFEEMSAAETVDWFVGRIIVAVGEGNLRTVIYSLILGIIKAHYDRGFKAGQLAGKPKMKK